MNNTFNIQRLGLLLKRQWLEFGKIYLITLAVALGVIVTFYGFSTWSIIADDRPFSPWALNFREPLFLTFGFLFITVIASSYFAHLGQKPKAIIDLMIPASTFEKFLTGILFTSILSTVSFIIIFYLTDLVFVSKLKSVAQNIGTEISFTDANGDVKTYNYLMYFFDKNGYDHKFIPIYSFPLLATSVFLLGSIYFNRFHYVKTAVVVMVFSGIWTYIIFKTGELMFEGKIPIDRGNNTNMNFDNPKLWAELGVFVFLLLLTAIFWVITYVRLKEKEV